MDEISLEKIKSNFKQVKNIISKTDLKNIFDIWLLES